MALNLEKIGRPICKIVGGAGKYSNKIISVAVNDEQEEETSPGSPKCRILEPPIRYSFRFPPRRATLVS